MSEKLEGLFRYLDGLTARAPLDELPARLTDLDIDGEDVADYIHFSGNHWAPTPSPT